MNDLGFCRESGAVYEGSKTGRGASRVHPTPLLLPIQFEGGVALPFDGSLPYGQELFREDSFDPVTRIRRGRVYTRKSQSQPWDWHVQDSFRQDLPVERWGDGGAAQKISLITYQRDPLVDLARASHKYPRVLLGEAPYVTFWKIISIEKAVTSTPVLTLKALYSLGDLPELVPGKIPSKSRRSAIVTWEKLEDSLNRSGPTDMVDRCRDMLSVVFGTLAGDSALDLGASVKAYVAKNKDREDLMAYAGKMVARFHSRGKPNEQHARSVRPPSDEDAQLAVRCVGLVVVEAGWAK